MSVVMDGRVFNAAPDRSLEQRLSALEKANEIRCGRAVVKAAIKRGELDPRVVLVELPSLLEGMDVLQFLTSIRYVGSVKGLGFCNRLGVSPTRKLGRMTARQREELASILRARR